MPRTTTSLIALVSLVISIVVASLAAAQSPANIPRVGFLDPGDPVPWPAFRQGLRELGYVEGTHLILERRSWEGHPDRAPDLIADLVRLPVDVLVVGGRLPVLAAQRATTTIPIVMVAGGDPVREGLIQSFARPGGNITGVTLQHPGLGGKSLELLRETIPQLSRVANLHQAGSDPATREELERDARLLGLQLQSLEVRGPTEFDHAFQAALAGRAEALFISETAMLAAHLERIVAFAAQHRLPTMGQSRSSAKAGLLMAYGPDLAAQVRRSAVYVDKILKGAKPADLPVERPMKLHLVINLKTARALGLTIPPIVLFQADEVIQ